MVLITGTDKTFKKMDIEKIKKQFGGQAQNYTKYRKPYPEELYDLLFSLIPKNSSNILDIACGTGKSTEDLLKKELAVFGCDHDALMIEEAERQAKIKKLDINYAVADAEKLPYEDESFDVVTVGTAFHFFMNTTAMSEIKRVLKKDGLLFIYWILTVKDIPEQDEIPSSIYRSYNWIKVPSELRSLEHVSSFLEENNLYKVSTKRIPFTYNTTIEERVGLQTTSGAYELFSDEDKKKFLEDVAQALKEKLGERPYFTLEEEIQICYGFKQ